MKRTHKWPAKALNLLVAMAMVISLVAVLAPAVTALTPAEIDCEPEEQFEYCNLEVFVNTYTKDLVTGDFEPVEEVAKCSDFYVNAVVINTGNETVGNITATIILGGIDVELDTDLSQTADIDWDGQLSHTAPGVMADFWWRVHCVDSTGQAEILVDVDSTIWREGLETDVRCATATGSVVITQIEPVEDRCVLVEIIEAPGLIYQDYPPSPFEQTVVPCTTFGIKAKITNNCTDELGNPKQLPKVNGTISWFGTYDVKGLDGILGTDDDLDPLDYDNAYSDLGALASLVGGDPQVDGKGTWCIDDLDYGESAIVAWTLHCDEKGDIWIWVRASEEACADTLGISLHSKSTYINDPWRVHQQTGGELDVEIITPEDCDEIRSGCGDEKFPIEVVTTNNGDLTVNNILVTVQGNDTTGTIFVFDGAKFEFIASLAPGASHTSNFTGWCKGPGPVEVTADASGTDALGDPVDADDDIVEFLQKEVQALMPLELEGEGYSYTLPSAVNICDTFELVGQFWNVSGTNWLDVDVCIYWRGDAVLLGNDTGETSYEPVYDRCQVAGPGWEHFDPLNGTVNGPDGDGWYSNCQTIPICDCCESRVKWTFECVGEVPVEAYVTMSETVGVDSWYDDSLECEGPPDCETDCEGVIITQEYKAHLIAGVVAFMQTEGGEMLQRNAFAPCQNFHAVMPVINVGNETAEDVRVDFVVIHDDTKTWDTWDVIGITNEVTGDAVEFYFDPVTGEGWADLGDIAGNSMKKAILQLHCAAEGSVGIQITNPGLTGTHANTGASIGDNIEVPACATVVNQIPFTVELVNPETCETVNPGDRFAVKALIYNGSSDPLEEVSATIYWHGEATLVTPQSITKYVGNDTDHLPLAAGSYAEITWEMRCKLAGEVFIHVTATSDTAQITTSSDVVNVHQRAVAEIEIEILSPGPCNAIATSEEFAVTARVNNTGALTAEDVFATILYYDDVACSANGADYQWHLDRNCITPGTVEVYFGSTLVSPSEYTIDYLAGVITFVTPPPFGTAISAYYLWDVSLVAVAVDGEPVATSPDVDLDEIAPGAYKTVTWTLHADTTCEIHCSHTPWWIGVHAWSSNAAPAWDDTFDIRASIYPAAHLVAEITGIDTAVGVCDEFDVDYTVRNTGEADAWEASVTLSVIPEGSVCIAEGFGGYTQYIGTLTGWGTDDYYTGTFTVHCKLACESTITITPAGFDECGWHPAEKTDMCDMMIEGPPMDSPYHYDCPCWSLLPGRAIPDTLIEPASETVRQIDSGGLDLEIAKYVDDAYPELEQTVEFTIMVYNYGPTDATGVVVADLLDAGLIFEMAETGDYGTYNDSTGVWDLGGLTAGAVATLQIWATVDTTDEIVNTAAITAVDQPDGFPLNDDAYVKLNQEAVTSVDIDLDEGWNLISMPLIPTNNDLETMLAPVWSDFIRAFKYDACTETWTSYIKDGPTPSLTDLDDGYGYWVLMDDEGTITVSGVVALDPPNLPSSYAVCEGWDLIGFKSIDEMTAGEYLAALQAAGVPTWATIWGFANGEYHKVRSYDMMEPGFGYWLAVLADGTIYP